MVSERKQIKQTNKALHRLQAEQTKSVRHIGGQRARLENSSRKMQSLESKAAKLEQHLHGLRNPGGEPLAQFAHGLRPARLIINPKGGTFAAQVGSPERLVAMLRAHGIQAEVYLKTSGRAVRQWVREAIDNEESLVIAVGGDGTIEDVALTLVGSRVTLGIIPAGTMNNLARELGIPLDIEQACALLGTGLTRQIDVGSIRANGKSKHTYFLETAGLGLAIVLPVGQAVKKGRWGKLPSLLRKLFAQKPGPVEIELDNGEKIMVNSQLVTVSNAPLYALNNMIAPEARMDDGLLDVAIYDGMNVVELASHFEKTLKSRRVDNPNVRFYRTRRVHIRSREEIAEVADGLVPVPARDKDQHLGPTILNFEVLPRAINVIVGQGPALNWPVDAVKTTPPMTGKQSTSHSVNAAEQHTNTESQDAGALSPQSI